LFVQYGFVSTREQLRILLFWELLQKQRGSQYRYQGSQKLKWGHVT